MSAAQAISPPEKPPDYSTLLSWWDAWPEARPELLDFWARGNFTGRLLFRTTRQQPACIVRARYLDELEAALKRLALLDLEIDFAWSGVASDPSLVMVPQDVTYEEAGGWGYMACAGDKLSDNRGDREWCPSLGYASLLPDTITDWLAVQARPFLESGRLMVCPLNNMGLHKTPGHLSEKHLQRISNSSSVVRSVQAIESLFKLELPLLEGMTIQDTFRFCEDHKDSLQLFQVTLAKLLTKTNTEASASSRNELLAQIKEEVAELRLSEKTISLRKRLTALGASLSTFGVTIALQLGVAPGVAALGSVAAAMATLALWDRNLQSQGEIPKHPFYIISALQEGKGPRSEWRERPFAREFRLPSRKKLKKAIPPYHWLAPPTGGWLIPSTSVRG